MAYLDYSPVEVADTTEGMRRLGDTLTGVMKRKQEREQFEKTQVFQREQEQRRLQQQQGQLDYQNKIEARKEKMAELDFNRRQQIDEDARMDRARKAATPQEAEAIVKGIHRYDPHTGQEIGQGKLTPGEIPDVGPAPQTPTAPVAPAFPQAEAGAVIPDIAQALPGMPPELAAMLRGKQKAGPQGPIPLDDLAQALPDAMPARKAEMAGQAERQGGKMFVDQINDQGIATLIDANGNKTHAPAQKGWREGALIGPDGQITNADAAEGSMHRFDPSVQGARFEGDQADPGRFDAAAAAYEKFQGEQRALPGQQQAYAQQMQALPGLQAEYEKKTRDAEGRRPYTMAVGDEPGVTFDFNTQRTGKRVQDAQDFVDTIGQLQLKPADMEAAKLARAAILAGADAQTVMKQFQQERITGIKQDYGHAEGLLRDTNRLDVQKLKNQAPRSSITVGEGNLNQRKFEQFQKDAERFAARYGIKNDISGLKALDDGINGIGGDNAALQRGVAFQLVRSMQGSGPVTDQDITQIRKRVAGAGGELETWLQEMDTGNLGPAEQKVLYDAVNIRLNGLKGRLQTVRDSADKHFLREQSPYRRWVGDDFIQSELDAMLPTTHSTVNFAAPTPAPPEVKAGRKGKTRVTGVAPDAVNGILDRLGVKKK